MCYGDLTKNYCALGYHLFLLVPQSLCNSILNFRHDDLASGHMRFDHTVNQTKQRFGGQVSAKPQNITSQFVYNVSGISYPLSLPAKGLHRVDFANCPFRKGRHRFTGTFSALIQGQYLDYCVLTTFHVILRPPLWHLLLLRKCPCCSLALYYFAMDLTDS